MYLLWWSVLSYYYNSLKAQMFSVFISNIFKLGYVNCFFFFFKKQCYHIVTRLQPSVSMTFTCTGNPSVQVTHYTVILISLWWSAPATSLRYVSTQQPQVTNGYHSGQHWSRTFPSSQKFYGSGLAQVHVDPTSCVHAHLEKAAKSGLKSTTNS